MVPDDKVSSYGIVAGDATEDPRLMRVRDMIEKPSLEEAPSRMAVLGRYIIRPEIFGILEHTAPGKGGEIQLTDALLELARQQAVYAYDFEGKRYDLGDKLGFLKATVEFALRREDLGTPFKKYLKDLVAIILGVKVSEEKYGESGTRHQRGRFPRHDGGGWLRLRDGALPSRLPGRDDRRPGGLVCRHGALPQAAGHLVPHGCPAPQQEAHHGRHRDVRER